MTVSVRVSGNIELLFVAKSGPFLTWKCTKDIVYFTQNGGRL
jgi:hypothetical protein